MEYRLIDIQPGNFFVRIDAQRARLAKFHISAARDIICIDGCNAAHEKGVRMCLLLQIEEMPDYIIARFTGPGAAEDVWQQYELIAYRCKRAYKNKLLLHFLEAHGEISLIDDTS